MIPSNEEKLSCVKRELEMRRRVYERRVAQGKMHQSVADREIEVMWNIVQDYEKLAQGERLL